MAKKYANVTGNVKTLSVKINPSYAFTLTVKPGASTTLTDEQVRGLINFTPTGWAISDVVDAIVDTPAEVLAVMGPLANTNPHNHNRYTNTEAVAAMGAKANSNPLNHDRYTNTEAVAAMGAKANSNPLNHDRYTDLEAQAAARNFVIKDSPASPYALEPAIDAVILLNNDDVLNLPAATGSGRQVSILVLGSVGNIYPQAGEQIDALGAGNQLQVWNANPRTKLVDCRAGQWFRIF